MTFLFRISFLFTVCERTRLRDTQPARSTILASRPLHFPLSVSSASHLTAPGGHASCITILYGRSSVRNSVYNFVPALLRTRLRNEEPKRPYRCIAYASYANRNTMGHRQDSPVTNRHHEPDDWEEWEDDDVVTPIDAGVQVSIPPPLQPVTSRSRTSLKPSTTRTSRLSTAKVRRLKSRHRQKAQNEKAGIRLITDMSAFKRNNHIAHQMRAAGEPQPKFVDAAALRALEGEPNSASVGNWNWLKRDKTQTPESATPQRSARTEQELSPDDRPIVIGISLPSDQMSSRDISPQTANTQTPRTPVLNNATGRLIPTTGSSATDDPSTNLQRSVWSPDTPDTTNSFRSNRAASSIYSQATLAGLAISQRAPPVPAVPDTYKASQPRILSLELSHSPEEEDSGTPCTLFEEDGPSPQKQAQGRIPGVSPESAGSRSQGWWDHVVTPFVDKTFSFSSRKLKAASPRDEERSPGKYAYIDEKRLEDQSLQVPRVMAQAPIVRAPTPRKAQGSQSELQPAPELEASSSKSAPSLSKGWTVQEKHYTVMTNESNRDQPPPYSPPKKHDKAAVRYRALFPPGHPLQAQFPPSPGPASPGLAVTMTSQGATQLVNVPLTPTIRSQTPPRKEEPLPPRPLGTYLPQEHAHAARGQFHKVERRRRRHEKEEVVARRLGGFWRGRGCVPAGGCYGRTGREGRKRRRVWVAIWTGIIALIILIVVLAVVLTRHHGTTAEQSIWVNLTDFPPMPTGVLTVVGPDNSASKSVCTEPSTLWSCSLPKDQQDSVAPYKANQPTVIMQIQWDNSTNNGWKGSGGEKPRRGLSAVAAAAGAILQARQGASGFVPQPAAPSFKEMFFLGNTTDNVQAENKAGEPTPFYISLLKSMNDTVSFPSLTKRGPSNQIGNQSLVALLPAPDLDSDGTPAPAAMLPNPVKQPVRLFDRGLPTEHYAFYTHFKRTIFVRSATILNKTDEGNVPLDENGGCRKTEADFLVTWAETRVLLQIWTRALSSNTSSLLNADTGRGITGTGELVRPGTMPYPVTVTIDTHGGDPKKKLVWYWPMDKRLKLDTSKPALLANNMGVGGTWINPRGTGDASVGGFDGGTGGCKCEWVNWVQTRK